MIYSSIALPLIAAGLHLATAIELNASDPASVKAASRTLAFGLQSLYHNNVSGTPETAIGTLPAPLYWWEAGAVWGGMIDYWAYTNDTSYNEVIQQALIAQIGPDANYMPPAYFSSLGNDDQAFWALAVLAALEYDFPVPQGQKETVWLDLATAVFNTQVPRWDTTSCGGGLRWQIFESNKGYTYKNSISNGALFQISARLAHYTGNQTYIDWAGRTWDWMSAIGLISPSYQVFDGSDLTINCTELDHTTWTYNPAMLLYGTSMMANLTNEKVWSDRTNGLLTSIENSFFSPFQNATSIMFEAACETFNTCNDDQFSFKAYLSRWMGKSTVVYPSITANVRKYLQASAEAAAQSCSGGETTNPSCGQKWYTGGYDGSTGVGQQLSAMETVQSLLLLDGSAAHTIPRHQPDVNIQVVPVTSTFPLTPPTSTPTTASSDSSSRPSHSGGRSNTNIQDRAALTKGNTWVIMALALIAAMAFGGGFGMLR